MDNKWKAAGKMALGAARVVSGVVTGTGHGLVGTYLKNHKMTAQAARLGSEGIKGGAKQFSEGLDEWKKS